MDDTKKPTCLGFIMDGNRRYAKQVGLGIKDGHTKGAEVLEDCVRWLSKEQIPHGVFFAFSTENWNRSAIERKYLMQLFRVWLKHFHVLATTERVRVHIIGQRTDFTDDLVKQMDELEAATVFDEPATTVWIALSYGGRDEIVRAVNTLVEEAAASGRAEKLSEESFSARLDTAEMPDPDMIIRTSGEQRLSNFLTWRSTYSELYFIEKHWPALTEEDFQDILVEYGKRERRRGK